VARRTWNKKYERKKSSSEVLDEKIKLLDLEMRKTKLGESIANSTSGLYTVTGFGPGDPAIPEIPAVPAVPPTYEDVTGGISNPDDFSWPDQGDGSDPDFSATIPDNFYTTYNGEQVPALRAIDTYNGQQVDYGDNPSLGGLAFRGGWLGWNYLGYPSASGIRGAGTTAFPGEGVGQALNAAFNNWPYEGRVVKTIYQWQQLDCLFGSCQGASQYYPAGLSATSTPKADYALYAWTLLLPADADGNLLPNRIMTDPGSPEIPAVPGVPEGQPKPVVLSRNALGDPNYYPGQINTQLSKLLGIASDVFDDILNNVTSLGSDMQRGIANILKNYPEGLPYSGAARALGQYANNIYNSGGKDGGIIYNPLTSSEVNSIVANMNPNLVGDFNPPGGKDSATLMVQDAIPQYSETHVVFGTIPNGGVSINSEGIKIVDPAYQFTPNEMSNIQNAVGDYAAGPLSIITVPLGLSLFGTNPPQDAPATLVQEIPMSVIKEQNPELYTELQKNPDFGKKSVNENYEPEINQINLKQIQFDSKNISEAKRKVDTINQLLKHNPKYIQYLRERYPASDPRVAKMNYQMDKMMEASSLYIETQFPENQRLFNKVRQAVKRSIKLTDPKTYKNVKDPQTVYKLLSVDYVNEYERPKRKLKLQSRNKKTAARFLKKPRIKTRSELIDEKIIQLEKDMKKTGMGA